MTKMEKDEEETTCGIFRWKSQALQKYATSKHFFLVYGFLGTIQAMSFVYFISTLTTIERRFKITSKTTGLMLSGNEVSQILLSLFLTYYGGQRNRPLWIAWGVACSSLSCFILTLPHFIFGPGEDALALTEEYFNQTKLISHGNETLLEQEPICLPGARIQKCDDESFSKVPALLIFISQFVLGIGTTLYFSLGQTYLDDNIKKENTPKLLGFSLALRTMGPAFGFFIGYLCLSIYIDPSLHPVINNKDPRWLGAWWLGWLVLGSAMLMFAFLISMFPKKLPPKKELDKNLKLLKGKENGGLTLNTIDNSVKVADNNNSSNKLKNNNVTVNKTKPAAEDCSNSLQNFPRALKRLLLNKLLMINIWSGIFYVLGSSGYITYITKYMEVQFHKTAAFASIATGPMAILSMCFGFLVSGQVISKFKPGPKYLLGWNVVVGLIFVLGQISFIFIQCKESAFQGYTPETSSMQFLNECNSNCSCESLKYSPVCHQSTQTTFYSACHAGCKGSKPVDAVTKEYTNCTCIGPALQLKKHHGPSTNPLLDMFQYEVASNASVTTGSCESDCGHSFLVFVIITCILHGLGSSGKIGNILVNYRSVSTEEKSFAQGLSLLMVSLFAFIPGPIIFGIIIDSTCMIWDISCGTKGNCKLYDKDLFRFRINVLGASITVIGALLDIVVCYLGKNLNLYEEEPLKRTEKLTSEEQKGYVNHAMES